MKNNSVKKHIVRPGRTIKENIKTPIPVSGLKVGMYVCELDRPWLDTPFVLQGFKITSLDDIDTLTEHCETLATTGGLDPQYAHPVEVPADRIVELVCVKDPLVHSGQVFDVESSF